MKIGKILRRALLAPLAQLLFALLGLLRLVAPPLARVLGRARVKSRKVRSVWAVTPILTLPLLARADRLLGLQSDSMVYVTYYITRDFDQNYSRSHQWVLGNSPSLYPTYCEIIFLLALLRYDVFHYFYDRGLMAPVTRFGIAPRELEYLDIAGKKLYTYAYGADVRERSSTLALGKWNFCKECDAPGKYCICDAAQLEQSMKPLIPIAKSMNAMGDMLTYVPNPNQLHYWPIDIARVPTCEARTRVAGSKLVVAHAPNHGHFKGTRYVVAAVEALQAEGYDIELRFIQGVPNTEVLALFAQADVVIDQLVGGFYGYTALEAMALGKPVVSFVRSEKLTLPGCPIINATPDTIVQTLKDIYDGLYDLFEYGQRGVSYVRQENSVEAVAIRLADTYLRTADFSKALNTEITARRDVLIARLAVKTHFLS